MAKVIHINIDSRREIDQELKKVCGEFTKDTITRLLEPLGAFLIKLSTKKASPNNDTHPDDSAEIPSNQVIQVVTQFQEAAEERLPFTIKKLQEYINDTKMEQILLKPIEINVLDYYKTFYQTVTTNQGNKIQPLDTPLMTVDQMATYLSQIIDNATSH
ncbi:hypothetical protein BC941DRAFT_408651 [Chlamydoabsidia padenii]|nr:hypothetical protein BC941DRAFT_408651 [Chlamydoabsidia padenii]